MTLYLFYYSEEIKFYSAQQLNENAAAIRKRKANVSLDAEKLQQKKKKDEDEVDVESSKPKASAFSSKLNISVQNSIVNLFDVEVEIGREKDAGQEKMNR